ncbi:MAG: AlpA family phage regulatory protein, partial [Gammaproteobacteria bacterium]|nr:AlpA family phage regulatory protein [Gammaproteobacteria bacterium]
AELLNLLPYGKSWLWEASRKGEFPAPRKLSARTTVWVRDEVVEWLDARLAK